MMSTENPVHYPLPVLEHALTPNEINDLFSMLQSQPSINSTSSSETNRSLYSLEERKRRRMISNRESARRSRWRKKKHIENLTSEANRLNIENRELKNRLCMMAHDCHLVQRDSNRLLCESIYLQQKLTGLNQILASAMQLPQLS
ncbi:Basic leucine zipper 4 [Sesamum alatum]|uniref:Basic leucine zipper 4 n=1 Tax=Sesamum alatum TaxID=300844 RepID=A0AAE1YQE5_9LAMI|nr:Basic leucine zipper 4 [Sesamum alatum]